MTHSVEPEYDETCGHARRSRKNSWSACKEKRVRTLDVRTFPRRTLHVGWSGATVYQPVVVHPLYRCAAVFVFSHAPRLNLEFSELMTPEEMSRLGFSEKAKEALSKVSDASFVGSDTTPRSNPRVCGLVATGEERDRKRQ